MSWREPPSYEELVETTGEEGVPLGKHTRERAAGVNYEKYISSLKWMRRKAGYYQVHPKRCQVEGCEVEEDVHLHHHTYDRLGREWDEDLVPLCEPHHLEVHELHRSIKSLSLTKATERVMGHKLPHHVGAPGSGQLRRRRSPKAKKRKVNGRWRWVS